MDTDILYVKHIIKNKTNINECYKVIINKLKDLMSVFTEPEKNFDELIEEGNQTIQRILTLVNTIGNAFKNEFSTDSQAGGTTTTTIITKNNNSSNQVPPPTVVSTPPTNDTEIKPVLPEDKKVSKQDVQKLIVEIGRINSDEVAEVDKFKKDQDMIIQNLFESIRLLKSIKDKISGITLSSSTNVNSVTKQSAFAALSTEILKLTDDLKVKIQIEDKDDKSGKSGTNIDKIKVLLREFDELLNTGDLLYLVNSSFIRKYNDGWEFLTEYEKTAPIKEEQIKKEITNKQEKINNIITAINGLTASLDVNQIKEAFEKLTGYIKLINEGSDNKSNTETPDLLARYETIKNKVELLRTIKTPELLPRKNR
jgi:hypothetical protein